MRAARPTRAARSRCTSQPRPDRPRQRGCCSSYGADISTTDLENEAHALGWAAFFGRPDIVEMLLAAGSAPSQRNKHGLTPLGCALGGAAGRWCKFSKATIEDWRRAADMIGAKGGVE
ncbi:MAG TPA: ankyrin repeat domain-containing protein [Burkholderiales bacterium]|nr:ankyrin repeat domain-containing protein [Burkholderiales bacterium]